VRLVWRAAAVAEGAGLGARGGRHLRHVVPRLWLARSAIPVSPALPPLREPAGAGPSLRAGEGVVTSERALKERIVRALRERGCVVIPQPATPMGLAGRPDLLVCVPPDGRFGALEVKRPGQTATVLQRHRLEEIARAGGIAAVVHSPEEALAALGLEMEHPRLPRRG